MKIGRLMGVELHLNKYFLALLCLFFIAGVLDKGLIAFGVVLAHEFAHVYTARRLNVPVAEVELLPFGGVTRVGADLVMEPSKELLVAAAGPMSNLLMAGLGIAFKNYGFWDENLGPFFLQCNLLIAAFNLLPALPLDGGRVYRSYLARRLSIRDATCRAAGLGQVWAVLIVMGGSLSLLLGLTGMDILLTGLFLFYAATRERGIAPYIFIRHIAQKKEELSRLGVLPSEIITSMEHIPLKDIIKHITPQKFYMVLCIDKEWRFTGMVTEAEIVDGLMEHGIEFPVGNLRKNIL